MPKTDAAPASPLDALADRIDSEQRTDAPQLTPEQQQQVDAAEQQFNAMMTKFGVFVGKALKAVRAGIARKLPEIRDEWTDENLQEFADAVPPVAMKYLGKLGPLLGEYPEECALILAAAPLVAGYVGAVSAHAESTARVIEAPRAAPAPAGAPGAAPAPTPTPVLHVG